VLDALFLTTLGYDDSDLWLSRAIESNEKLIDEQNIAGIFIHVSICSVVVVGGIITTALLQQA
jgi:hypothetical protein